MQTQSKTNAQWNWEEIKKSTWMLKMCLKIKHIRMNYFVATPYWNCDQSNNQSYLIWNWIDINLRYLIQSTLIGNYVKRLHSSTIDNIPNIIKTSFTIQMSWPNIASTLFDIFVRARHKILKPCNGSWRRNCMIRGGKTVLVKVMKRIRKLSYEGSS